MKIEQISDNLKRTSIYLRLGLENVRDPELITGYSFYKDTKLFEMIPDYGSFDKNKVLYILDIETYNRYKGYGTLLLKYLTNKAKEERFEYIMGWLPSAIGFTFDTYKAFYEKTDFEVYKNIKEESFELGIVLKRI